MNRKVNRRRSDRKRVMFAPLVAFVILMGVNAVVWERVSNTVDKIEITSCRDRNEIRRDIRRVVRKMSVNPKMKNYLVTQFSEVKCP